MIVIGLTGNIGSGKSCVANMFKQLGAKIIDADLVARSIVQPGEIAWAEIIEEFGDEILNNNKTINRKKLGNIVFSNKEKIQKLNNITHPRIIARIKELINRYKEEASGVVIIEAALIVEKGGLKNLIDYLIVVRTEDNLQLNRIIKRDNISKKEAISRIKSQMPVFEKAKYADFLIENSGTIEETRRQVEEIWAKLIK